MQIRVSPEVGRLLDDATAVSIRRGRSYVGVDHLFEAVVDGADLLPPEVSGPHLEILRKVVGLLELAPRQDGIPADASEVYYTPRCAAVTNEAARLAERLRSAQTSAGHVLLAILADAHAAPSRVMDRVSEARGTIIEDLRKSLMNPNGAVAKASSPGSADEAAAATEAPSEPPAPSFESFTRDLTQAAREGKIEPAIGRDKEILEIIEVLARRGKHNVIVVGEAGVGKTKIVEGLALLSAQGRLGDVLGNKRLLELNLAALMSGTQFRGAFEEKVTALLDELQRNEDTMLFIDEIHLIMGAGATDGDSMDFANLLKPALGRGELRCIGATTLKEYRKFIERDAAIERRFQMIRIEALSPEAAHEVLRALKPSLEKHHGVSIGKGVLSAVVSLTERYLPNRQLPDKAIDVLDQTCARRRIAGLMNAGRGGRHDKASGAKGVSGEKKITPHDVRKVVSQLAAVPLEEITAEERVRLTDLDERLRSKIVGQDEAVAKAVAAVKKSRMGLADPNRPDAAMLFLGPTGVGKSQLAKELALAVYGSSDHLISFDMSEYAEPHSISRLIGAPPGYAGSDEEGLLVEVVRNTPFSILLFDELEKAHPRIFDLLLPILDEGRLRDSHGRFVRFTHCIIIFTSNIGADYLYRPAREEESPKLIEELRGHFRPEFINRIDEIVPFYPLLFEDVRAILKLMIDGVRKRIQDKRMGIRMYQRAYEHLAEEGYSEEFGARELQRTVERRIVNPISELLLSGEIGPGDMIDILMEDDELTFRKGRPHGEQ